MSNTKIIEFLNKALQMKTRPSAFSIRMTRLTCSFIHSTYDEERPWALPDRQASDFTFPLLNRQY